MLEIKIDEADILYAENRSKLVGAMSGSRTAGKGNVVGFLGELIVSRIYDVPLYDTFEYDMIIDGQKIDVKTKSCSSEPKSNYKCSVMSYQLKNEVDGYIFARANLSAKIVWVLGYFSKQDLVRFGQFAKKGEPDGNFLFTEDCWSITIAELKEFGGVDFHV